MIASQYKFIPLWLRLLVVIAIVAGAGYYFQLLGKRSHDLASIPDIPVTDFSAPVQAQIREARKQLQATPEDPALNARLGMILHAYKLLPPAIACYQRAHWYNPGDYAVTYYLGIARAQGGNDMAAIRELRATLELNPDYRPARLRLAEVLYKTGELQEARALYELLLQDTPDSPWVQHGLAQVLAAQGEPADAIEHNLRAVELYPAFGPAHYALALAYRDQGEAEAAARHMELYRRYQKQTPPHVDPLLQALDEYDISATAQVRRARQLEQSGRLVDALLALEQAVEAEPQSVEAHSQLVRLYHLFDDFDKAEQHYRAAVAIAPGTVMANLHYGTYLAEQGRYADATAAFGKVLAANPDHADAHTLQGQAYEELQQPDKAVAHYRQALATQPRHRQANFLLGRHLLNAGQASEAIPYFEKTLTPGDEHNAQFLYQIALAFMAAGHPAEARSYLQRAAKLATTPSQTPLADEINRTMTEWEQAGRE